MRIITTIFLCFFAAVSVAQKADLKQLNDSTYQVIISVPAKHVVCDTIFLPAPPAGLPETKEIVAIQPDSPHLIARLGVADAVNLSCDCDWFISPLNSPVKLWTGHGDFEMSFPDTSYLKTYDLHVVSGNQHRLFPGFWTVLGPVLREGDPDVMVLPNNAGFIDKPLSKKYVILRGNYGAVKMVNQKNVYFQAQGHVQMQEWNFSNSNENIVIDAVAGPDQYGITFIGKGFIIDPQAYEWKYGKGFAQEFTVVGVESINSPLEGFHVATNIGNEELTGYKFVHCRATGSANEGIYFAWTRMTDGRQTVKGAVVAHSVFEDTGYDAGQFGWGIKTTVFGNIFRRSGSRNKPTDWSGISNNDSEVLYAFNRLEDNTNSLTGSIHRRVDFISNIVTNTRTNNLSDSWIRVTSLSDPVVTFVAVGNFFKTIRPPVQPYCHSCGTHKMNYLYYGNEEAGAKPIEPGDSWIIRQDVELPYWARFDYNGYEK